jgi:energy-coupling factor transport system substrate-specific component
MKKAVIVFTVIVSSLSLLFTFTKEVKVSYSLIVTLSVLGLLFLSYFYFEKSSMGTKEIAIIGTLSAFAGVGRAAFAFMPGAQPTTFIVAVSGLVFGPYEGFLVGSTAAFISNIFLGQGPWSPWQMFGWGIVGLISGFIGKKKTSISSEWFAVICFGYGFLFNWIMNLWHVLGYINPLTLKSIMAAYMLGITFDVIHAVSNFIFCIVFYERFVRVLTRFKKRLEITYLN